MAPTTETDPTSLTETFDYQNRTHSYTIKWRALGDPSSPPIVFIHGTPWSSRVWVSYALALSCKFHVYIFDNPGFGESPPERELPGKPFKSSDEVTKLDADLARQSEVFAALFKMWGKDWDNQKPHVIAHDHAGLMSLRAYLLHDCRYASLCLIDVVAIGPFGQSLFDVVAEDPSHFQKLPDMAFEGILESYIHNAAFSALSKETMQVLKAPWLREGGKAGFIRQLCQAGSRNTDAVEGRYGEVGEELPVKIIWGAQDAWIRVDTAWKLGKALGAKEIAVIEDAGHLIMYDQGAQLGVELGGWLGNYQGS